MKPFEQLAITSHLPFAIIAEFVTWCMRCRLEKERASQSTKVKISSRRQNCIFELEQLGEETFVVTVSPAGAPVTGIADVQNVVRAALGMHRLGAHSRAEGQLSQAFPDQKFLDKACPEDRRISSLDQEINAHSHLTLADLQEIHDLLIDQPGEVSDLFRDEKFLRVFPSIDYYQGMYGFPRHRSGNQIFIDWVDQKYVVSHGIDAPNPSDPLYEAFLKERGVESDEDDGFARYQWKRWKLAQTLGQVPDQFKSKVFDWVSQVTFDVEEFHSTRGGFPIPEKFEYFYCDSVIFADRELNFEIIDC